MVNSLQSPQIFQFVGDSHGHQHVLSPFVPDLVKPYETLTYNSNYSGVENKTYKGYLTDFNFYGFMAGRPFADDQISDEVTLGKSHYTGLHIRADLNEKTNRAEYINSRGGSCRGLQYIC